jgi:DNA-binding NtrC family response regulator
MEQSAVSPGAVQRRVWIVEDEPAAATLAADLCGTSGAEASIFRIPLTFLTELRLGPAPAAVVLDWRLEHELSAALFMAVRHRHPRLPIIYWTGSPRDALPAMIRDDGTTVIVDKAAGSASFEQALAWAFGAAPDPERQMA